MADTVKRILLKAVRDAIDAQKAAQTKLYEATADLVLKQTDLQGRLATGAQQISANQTELRAIDVLLAQLAAERDSLQA